MVPAQQRPGRSAASLLRSSCGVRHGARRKPWKPAGSDVAPATVQATPAGATVDRSARGRVRRAIFSAAETLMLSALFQDGCSPALAQSARLPFQARGKGRRATDCRTLDPACGRPLPLKRERQGRAGPSRPGPASPAEARGEEIQPSSVCRPFWIASAPLRTTSSTSPKFATSAMKRLMSASLLVSSMVKLSAASHSTRPPARWWPTRASPLASPSPSP